jgi:hypothetical protein
MINLLLVRRAILSINDMWRILVELVKPYKQNRDNIENAMDAFVLAALDTYHYKDVSEFGRSLYY